MLRIAAVTDVHAGPDTGRVRGHRAVDILANIVNDINWIEPNLVIDLGDRITDVDDTHDRRQIFEVAQEFARIKAPRLHLQGNHDKLPLTDQEESLRSRIGNRAIELNGWRVLALHSFNETIGGNFSADTLNWLERKLSRSNLPTIVVSHQPLHDQAMLGNPYFEFDYAEHACVKNANQVRKILETSPQVKLCLSGHAHWNDYRNIAGIHHVTLMSMSESWATGGEAAESWALLEADDNIRIKVFGKAPQELTLPLDTPARATVTR